MAALSAVLVHQKCDGSCTSSVGIWLLDRRCKSRGPAGHKCRQGLSYACGVCLSFSIRETDLTVPRLQRHETTRDASYNQGDDVASTYESK